MRLIDADALMEQPVWLCGGWVGDSYAEGYMDALDKVEEMLKSAPTVDAVPVVRCMDCRYYQDNNGGYPNADCKWCKDETPDADDFCSCGERKNNE